jgi:hypothetical protein
MKRYRRRAARSDTITPAAVAAYHAGNRDALRRELHLKPWQPSPLDVDGRCPWPKDTAGAKAWPACVVLRAALETELKETTNGTR